MNKDKMEILYKSESKKTLPSKPSELLFLAIEDLEKVEKSEKYRVDMENWHLPSLKHNFCSVCFSGSVMAFSLDASSYLSYVPGSFKEERHKLIALNYFRIGQIRIGLGYLGINTDEYELNREVTEYANNPVKFKSEMRELAEEFKERGY